MSNNTYHFFGMSAAEKVVANSILSSLKSRKDLDRYNDVAKREVISRVLKTHDNLLVEYGNLLDEVVEELKQHINVHSLEGGKRKHKKRHTTRARHTRRAKRRQSKRSNKSRK